MPSFYQIFETDLSAQSHKQHDRHNFAISSYPVYMYSCWAKSKKATVNQFHYLGYIQGAPKKVIP